MSSTVIRFARRLVLTSFAIGSTIASGPLAFAEQKSVLSERAMAGAIDYFGLVTGRPLDETDRAWLKKRWADQFAETPLDVIAQLDEFLAQFEAHEADPDALTLAASRNRLVDATYCAAKQTSDPDIHRLQHVLAPEELILASDCVFGMVVTRFDVDGMVASRNLMASIAGMDHDPTATEGDVTRSIESGFGSLEPAIKAVLAEGETRHAVAARFWSRMDGDPRRAELTTALEGDAAEDLPSAARHLENLALERLGSVDYLAEAGGLRLTGEGVGAYFDFLQPIAGKPFTLRDRIWVQDAIVSWFLNEPLKVTEAIASFEQSTRGYLIESDPDRRAAIVDYWAAHLHCELVNSTDADEIELLEIVFRENPVVSSDCDAIRVERHDDTVLAEADGITLTQEDLKASLDWMAFIFGRRITRDEAAFDRDYLLKLFDDDPSRVKDSMQRTRQFLAEYERKDLGFLKEKYRRQMTIENYCHYQESTRSEDKALLEMFRRNNEVVFVDCENKVMTTRADIDAGISSLDFLASIAGAPTFDPDERTEIHDEWSRSDLTYAQPNRIALAEWWSMLDIAGKQDVVARLRNSGIDHAADAGAKIREWLDHAKLQAVLLDAKRDQCELMAVISRGQTALFAAESGRFFLRNSIDVAGFSTSSYAAIASNTNAFAAFCS